ncbi:hypothetical protein MBLNU459_g2294t2 [Dothideomycetes sp. NU459]
MNHDRLDEELAVRKERSPLCVDSELQIVDWDGPDDPENPFNWPTGKKWLITLVVLFGTTTVLINGTSITVAAEAINEEFGVSDATFPNSYWPVTSWTLGGGIFMMILLPLMEDFGVRWAYLVTYAVFVVFIVPQAVAKNFATLVVTRFFAGGCVSILANTVSSIICDIWAGDVGRTVPMSLYITCYLVGSTAGPVVGATIFEYLQWRWILYIQLIWYAAFFPLFFFVVRETRGPVLLRQRAKRIRAATGRKAYTRDELVGKPLMEILLTSIKRPLYMLCTEWVVFSFTLWSSFAVGTVYLFTQSVAQVFAGLYGWEAYQTGYVQGAVVVGELLGWFASLLSARLYFASAKRNTETPGQPIPEARLYMSVFGGFVGMTGGMFVYAWTSYPYLPWIAPTIGLGMVGFGINVVVTGIADYVTDAYSKYAASAIAVVAFGENVFSGFLPLAAMSMYNTMGYQWASSLLGFLSLLLSLAPVLLLFKGRSIRARSPFISQATYDHEAPPTT